jgi:hypothetical protein
MSDDNPAALDTPRTPPGRAKAVASRFRRPAATARKPGLAAFIAVTFAVAAVAAIAGVVSYGHIETLALSVRQPLAAARMLPGSVDFLIVAGSAVLLSGSPLGWFGVIPGVAATLFANVESGVPYGPLAATIAAWPAVAFTLATLMLERWLKHQASVPAQTADARQANYGRDTGASAARSRRGDPDAGTPPPPPAPPAPEPRRTMPARKASQAPRRAAAVTAAEEAEWRDELVALGHPDAFPSFRSWSKDKTDSYRSRPAQRAYDEALELVAASNGNGRRSEA